MATNSRIDELNDDELNSICALALVRPMVPTDLRAVVAIENQVSPAPWTHGIFNDCLNRDYDARVAADGDRICGFSVLTHGYDESHILNLAVAPAEQRRGIGRQLLASMISQTEQIGSQRVLLEVRVSNHRALALYRNLGFSAVGRRNDYYPCPDGSREDALVMAIDLASGNSRSF